MPNLNAFGGDRYEHLFNAIYKLKPLGEPNADSARRTLEELLKSNKVVKDNRNHRGQTILCSLVDERGMSDGIVSIVARSLEYPVVRALVNVKDNAGRNPLSWAAERNYLDLARLLIYSDADIDSKSNVGRTPLSYAAGHDSKDVMELLLSHGAKAESTDREGRTPLSYAAGHDNKDVMELLLSHGAKVDPTDEEGRTPLSWWFSRIFDTQVRPSDQEVKTTVPLLLTDSNPLLQDEKYAIFLLWAAGTPDHNGGNASVKILDPFYFWGRAFGDVIHFWLEAENAWYKPTSEAESIIHRRDSSQRTLLHEAASSGHTFIAAKLLENGADIDAKDRHEATPLKVAIQMGNRGAVELLLGHGAQVQDIIMAQDWRDYIGVLGLAGSVLVLCEEQRNEAQRPPREPALFPAKRPNHLLKRSHDIIKGISDAGRISSIPAYQKRRYYEAPYDNNALRIGSFLVSPAGVHIDIRMPDLVAPNTQTTVRIGPRTNTTVRIGPHTNTTIEISPHTDKIVQIAWKPPRAYNESGTFWPMDFYSTLPYGWVPEGSIHLFCLFLDHLKQMWLELCKKWHSIVSGTVRLLQVLRRDFRDTR